MALLHAGVTLEEAVREAVRAAAMLAAAGRAPGPSPARLDDLLVLRSPVDEAGQASVEVYEALGPGRLLRRAAPPRRPSPPPAGVDSSSGSVETPSASIVVAAASLSLHGQAEAADWPPLYEYPRALPPGPPFVRLLPNAPLEGWEPPPWVAVENPAGAPYGPDYSRAQAMDEARVALENWALRTAAALAREAGEPLVVFVDGPLYLVPGALARPGAPVEVEAAWRRLVEDRVSAVEALEAAGGVAVGVVKRLSRSRILSRAPGVPCGRGDYSDEALIYAALARGECVSGGPRAGAAPAYKTGKYLVRPPGGVGVPPRIVEYLAIPPTPWSPGSRGALIVRVEYTERGLATLKSMGLEPHQAYLAASVALGSRLPVPLLASDRRSRSIASALRRLVAAEAARAGVPLDYESLVEEAVERWRRGGPGR